MNINENTGAFITVNEAQAYVTAFRSKYPDEIKGGFIGINVVTHLLKGDVMGIRIYNAMDEQSGTMNYVLVGVDRDGNDVTTIIADRLAPCPANCDRNSPLY